MVEITHKCLICRLQRLLINLRIQHPGIRSNLVYEVLLQDNMQYLMMDEDNLHRDKVRMGILGYKDKYVKLVHHILNNKECIVTFHLLINDLHKTILHLTETITEQNHCRDMLVHLLPHHKDNHIEDQYPPHKTDTLPFHLPPPKIA